MNFLRRIYLLLLGLLLVIAVTLLLLSPQAVGAWVGSISELSSVFRLGLTIVIDLFLLILMYLQVRPDPGAKVNGLVMRGSGAITEVSVESARDRILKAVRDVSDVVSAEAAVKPVRGRADIEMQVTVMGHDVKLPNKQKEINRALRQVIDKQLGLRMAGQPRIHIRIHGEETSKPPVITSPPVPSLVEKEAPLAPVAPMPPTKTEPEPEPAPSTGLVSRWGRGSESETMEEDKVEPQANKPESIRTVPEPEPEPERTNPLSSLFGGLRRDHAEKDEADEEEDIAASWSISVPQSKQADTPAVPPPDVEVAKTVADEIDENDEDDKLPVLVDLDEELSHSSVDDFVDDDDDEPEKSDMIADETPDPEKPDDNRL